MPALGYALLGEEHGPDTLVRNAVLAEQAGFEFAIVSDHIHPWSMAQGHSPFVWAVLGAMANATSTLTLGTGVTCPTVRIHPAIIAHAAATVGMMMPRRFFLGVGSGENLNEHVLGDHWPRPPVRLAMLEEAIEVIRGLWQGEMWSHDGEFYTVEDLQIFDIPEQAPPILCSATGPVSARLAAGTDGIIVPGLQDDVLTEWGDAGGSGPAIGMFHLVYAEDADEARDILAKQWAHAPLGGSLNLELRTPQEFDAASEFIRPEDYDESIIPLGPDPAPIIEQIEAFSAAGFDHVILHNIGPDQEAFLEFYERELAPAIDTAPSSIVAQ